MVTANGFTGKTADLEEKFAAQLASDLTIFTE
jgi:hypothetical protein